MSYAEMDLAIVPAAAPTRKNHLATSCPAPISARTPYHKGFKFTSRACGGRTPHHRIFTSCYAYSMAQTSASLSAANETSKHQPLQLSWKRLTRSAEASNVKSAAHPAGHTEQVLSQSEAAYLVSPSSHWCRISVPGCRDAVPGKLVARQLLGVVHQLQAARQAFRTRS